MVVKQTSWYISWELEALKQHSAENRNDDLVMTKYTSEHLWKLEVKTTIHPLQLKRHIN